MIPNTKYKVKTKNPNRSKSIRLSLGDFKAESRATKTLQQRAAIRNHLEHLCTDLSGIWYHPGSKGSNLSPKVDVDMQNIKYEKLSPQALRP